MVCGDGWYVWSGYFGRDYLAGCGVHTGRLEETTAEERHLQMLVCACRSAIEMDWDNARVDTVLQTDGWPFSLSEGDGSESNSAIGDAAHHFLGYKP